MAKDIDVYQLVRSFAARNHLSEIEYRSFAQALQRQAKAADQAEPVFRDLSSNPDLVLAPRLVLLAKDKKLVLETSGNEIRSITLPERFTDAFLQEYRRIDENADVPFPDEDSLKLLVPGEWIQTISIDTDLASASDQPGKRSVPLFRITFPENVRALVIPSNFVPDKLLEYAVLKLRQYLRKGANKEYLQNKLLYAFPGRESQVKDALASVLTKPYEAIEELKRSTSDFTFSFWAYLISAVKKDFEKKGDKTGDDLSLFQASMLIEFYSNHFKGKAQRKADLELSFKALDGLVRKAPFNFSLDEILAFKDGKGVPLVTKLGHDVLESYLREKSTKAEPGQLPELLVISAGGKRAYVAKDKALLLAVRLIAEARADIRSRIVEKWRRLLEEFRSAAPMEGEEEFRNMLKAEVEERFPILDALVGSRLLPVIQEEARVRGDAAADLERFFYKNDLVPLEEILDLQRKDLLSDARMLLPFWYTLPIISDFVRLFRRMGRRKAERAAPARLAAKIVVEPGKQKPGPEAPASAGKRKAEFAAAAVKVAKELTPSGFSMEEYLRDLESRWNTLLNLEAKRNLSEDVNSLVRDYLRGILRSMKGDSLTVARVKSLAATLADSPSLAKIKNHQALELYIQLYMAKVLGAGGTRL
jgi:hypothetical protein